MGRDMYLRTQEERLQYEIHNGVNIYTYIYLLIYRWMMYGLTAPWIYGVGCLDAHSFDNVTDGM